MTKDFHTWWSGYAAKVFHKPVTEVLEGFSFEKNPKASGKKESSQPKGKASEKRKADSGSTQPEGKAS